MRRRTLFLGVASALTVPGCSRSSGSTSASASAVAASLPTGDLPVIGWSLLGGDLTEAQLALRPPRLAIYSTGEVIADAAYRYDLPLSDVADLVDSVAEDLQDPDVADLADGLTIDSTATTTQFTVRTDADTYTVEAAALDEVREDEGYSAALYDASDQIAAIHEEVVASGQPYISESVRLVVDLTAPDVDLLATALPWPEAIAVPAATEGQTVVLVDLEGQEGRDVITLLTRDLDLNGAWEAYQTASGTGLRASWRYRLPHE